MSREGESSPAASVSPSRLPLVIAAGVLLCYLPLLTKNYYWDGIFFARVIEEARGLDATLLHPNHLIYNVLGYLLYKLARGVGLQVRAVEVLQVLNCFFGAASAYVLFRILQDCFRSVYLSACLTLLFAFSATWWKFATDADSYIASVFFLLVSFYFVLPHRRPRPLVAAGAHALSMLFHQLAVFFFPVAALGVFLQTASEPTKRRLTHVFKYAAAAFLFTFPLFLYSFYLTTGGLKLAPLARWLTNFSPEHGFTFSFSDNLTYTLRGHSRLIAGGRLSFLRDLNDPWMYVMAALTLAAAAAFFYQLLRRPGELKAVFRRAPDDDGGRLRALRLLCVVWFVCYVVFLFFFIPQNTFYRLFYLPALVVFLGSVLAPRLAAPGHVRRYRLALFVALLAVANLTFTAYPYSQARATPPLALALGLNKSWRAGTTIYFSQWNTDNELIRYFNPQTVWREVSRETLEPAAVMGGDGPAWMDTTLIDLFQSTPEGARWLDAHTVRRPEHELVNDKFNLKFYEIDRDTLSP